MHRDTLDFEIGAAILTEYDGDDFQSVQVGEFGDHVASSPLERHAPYGLDHRIVPGDVDASGQRIESKSAQVLYAYEADVGHAWCQEDPRVVKHLPPLRDGESRLYGAVLDASGGIKGACFVRTHNDGRVSMYTTDDGTPNGKTISRYASPDPLIGGIVDVSPWGTAKLNQTGYHLVLPSGAELHGGGVGGVPAPVGSLVRSYWQFDADAVVVNAKSVTLGIGPAEPLVKAESLKSYLALIANVMTEARAAILHMAKTLPDAPGVPPFNELAARLVLDPSFEALNAATSLLEAMTSNSAATT